jgi:hypothetical protein
MFGCRQSASCELAGRPQLRATCKGSSPLLLGLMMKAAAAPAAAADAQCQVLETAERRPALLCSLAECELGVCWQATDEGYL